MKKYGLPLLLIAFALFIFGVENVHAAQCSDQYYNPWMTQGWATDKVGPKVSLKTSAASCYGSDTQVWFSGFQSLPPNYPNGSGWIYVNLYEDDPDGNADEHVKEYIGYITNRVITTFTLNYTYTPGIIDSSGDQYCELYCTFGISGNQGQYMEKNIFLYKMCML